MKQLSVLVALTSYVTSQDIFALPDFKSIMENARAIHAIALTGSAAAGDTGLLIKHGEKQVAKLFLTATGVTADFSVHKQSIGYARANKQSAFTAFPTVNATTNGVYVTVWYS